MVHLHCGLPVRLHACSPPRLTATQLARSSVLNRLIAPTGLPPALYPLHGRTVAATYDSYGQSTSLSRLPLEGSGNLSPNLGDNVLGLRRAQLVL